MRPRLLDTIGDLAEASILALAFALAILLLGLPIVLFVRILHALLMWIVAYHY